MGKRIVAMNLGCPKCGHQWRTQNLQEIFNIIKTGEAYCEGCESLLVRKFS